MNKKNKLTYGARDVVDVSCALFSSIPAPAAVSCGCPLVPVVAVVVVCPLAVVVVILPWCWA
jgi:hypothetical protein